MSKCTKPNCDCLERAEKANSGPLKDGYQCLYNTDAVNAAKEKSRPSPSLPETEQGDKFDIDHFWESHKRTFGGVNAGEYIDREDFEKALHLLKVWNARPPDQPVPEEVMEWIVEETQGFGNSKSIWASGALAMHRRDHAAVADLQRQLNDWKEINEDKKRLVRELDIIINTEEGAAKQASLCDIVAQLAKELPSLQSRLSSTEAERDRLKNAFDVQAKLLEELQAERDAIRQAFAEEAEERRKAVEEVKRLNEIINANK